MTTTDSPIERTLSDGDKAAIRASFDKLKEAMPGFKPRRSQNRMVASAAMALGRSSGVLVSEAPCGVGKSLAYLSAGIPIAMRHGLKLVISTATVALQEQLMRDLPMYLKATGTDATYALAKGRQRYLCTRNLLELAGQGPVQDELGLGDVGFQRAPKAEEIAQGRTLLKKFQDQSWNGDLDAASPSIPDELRSLITTTAGGCAGKRCPQVSNCPLLKARKEVREADIVIANHDSVLASLMMPSEEDGVPNIIADPKEALYVLDEGHHWASKAIEVSASHFPLELAVRRLEKLPATCAMPYRLTGKPKIGGKTLTEVHELIEETVAAVEMVAELVRRHWDAQARKDRANTWRAPLGRLPAEWVGKSSVPHSMLQEVLRWTLSAHRTVSESTAKQSQVERALRELGMLKERLEDHLTLWGAWSRADSAGQLPIARWVSANPDGSLVCHASPISAAELLESVFWDRAAGVVLTSATLSAGGDFRALCEAIALPGHAELLSLDSPFNLHEQATLEIPKFPLLPDSPDHPKALADWFESGLNWEESTLALFTSRRKMEACAALMSPARRALIKVQGEKSKAVLLSEHSADVAAGKGSVIFALVGMGEGVDLKGDLCKTVVVTQLPFARPDDPVGATLAEWMESCGRNPFLELTVPDALRVLTQFFGRLIRTETDTGRLVLLDPRIIKKRYGKTILDGLPPFRQVIER